jgi:hypothetical protein
VGVSELLRFRGNAQRTSRANAAADVLPGAVGIRKRLLSCATERTRVPWVSVVRRCRIAWLPLSASLGHAVSELGEAKEVSAVRNEQVFL